MWKRFCPLSRPTDSLNSCATRLLLFNQLIWQPLVGGIERIKRFALFDPRQRLRVDRSVRRYHFAKAVNYDEAGWKCDRHRQNASLGHEPKSDSDRGLLLFRHFWENPQMGCKLSQQLIGLGSFSRCESMRQSSFFIKIRNPKPLKYSYNATASQIFISVKKF